MSEAIAYCGLADFLEGEERADRRHELVGGRVYLMAGGSERHDLAAGLLFEALAPGARRAGCRPFTANRLVRTRYESAYYPDVMIACGKAPHRLYETDPTLVIEVLSPSTADIDRREKAPAFAASGSLDLFLLVDPDNRRIEAARVVGGQLVWNVYASGDFVPTSYGDLDVDAFYDDLDQVASTP